MAVRFQTQRQAKKQKKKKCTTKGTMEIPVLLASPMHLARLSLLLGPPMERYDRIQVSHGSLVLINVP